MASTRRPERPPSSDADRDELWKPMLDSISSGKRLPEKSLLVLGGTPDSQRDFLDAVDPQPRARRPPVANQFALGYTYHDVLDSDHEDTLARLSLYLLSRPSPAFTPLIRPYLTPRTLPHMLVVILLDWNQPWQWVRQLRDWIRVLRSLILSLDDSSKLVLEDNIAAMQATGRPTGPETNPAMDAVKLPLGPGEWDEPLGIPLCVVCQNANKIETLEKERGWNDDEFDFILQYMRTLLLKHGASLIYTMPSAAGSLQTLLHSTLGIKSLLKQEPLRHNVTDRDRVLVPPNWDSWAKIRILRDGFDVEGVSEKWGVDIDIPQHMRPANPQVPMPADADVDADADPDAQPAAQRDDGDNEASATSIYEETIRNPESDFPLTGLSKQTNGIEVASKDPQTFLTEQVSVLDQLRREDETEAAQRASRKETEPASRQWTADDASGVVEEHIGPVQFNMGGIHVNADEMVKRLQDREASRSNDPSTPPPKSSDPSKMDNDKLMSFFSGLINKGSGSNANSPRGP